jgi:hypothetical protein
MSYISRAATSTWLWICSFAAMLLHVTALVLAIPVLAVWLFLDVLPRRGPIPLTSTPRIRHKLPRLYRDGSDVFMWMPDGTTIPLEPLEVSILVENISSVAAGAFVYEKTRIKLDENL